MRRKESQYQYWKRILGTIAEVSEFSLFSVLMTAQGSDARENCSAWLSCKLGPWARGKRSPDPGS